MKDQMNHSNICRNIRWTKQRKFNERECCRELSNIYPMLNSPTNAFINTKFFMWTTRVYITFVTKYTGEIYVINENVLISKRFFTQFVLVAYCCRLAAVRTKHNHPRISFLFRTFPWMIFFFFFSLKFFF